MVWLVSSVLGLPFTAMRQCSVLPRSQSQVPILFFTHVNRVLYWNPQASTIPNASGR